MSKVAQAVQEFLQDMRWKWEEWGENRYRVFVPGRTGQWLWLVDWDADDTYLGTHSIGPMKIPAKQRPAVAEYLTRANYNLRLGNFEMDYSDGEFCFKTSVPLRSVEPNMELVRDLAFANFAMMDRYLPGLMGVAFGRLSPRAAIRNAERPGQETAEEDDDPEDQIVRAEGSTRDRNGRIRTRMLPATRKGRPMKKKICQTQEDQRLRRVEQFATCLRMMDDRVHKEAEGSCFLIFCEPDREDAPAADDKHGASRTVQFCFEKDWFAADIPNTNLYPTEAERILKERRGFYREAERPDAGVTTDVVDLVEFDPVGKKYIYGDEQEAAEDAAYVFFDVWGLPLDAKLVVTASAFDGADWEKEMPLE